MEILSKESNKQKNVSLILGFFDGIHAGHRNVIKNTLSSDRVLVTLSSSPAEYFGKNTYYIYPRKYNYKLVEELGVKYIYELNFSEIVNITAKDYLDMLISEFKPVSITTGFNHSFGANREGNPHFLNQNSKKFQYLCTPATAIDNTIVSSTEIKKLLKEGNIEKANTFLGKNFILSSKVIKGNQLGRELGFPTANMNYPEKIIKIPYGVYKVNVLGKPAIMNWGIKPTIGAKEVIEVHIPNFNEDLYDKDLDIEIFCKIREEQKFNNLDELKQQIKKDIETCLKS